MLLRQSSLVHDASSLGHTDSHLEDPLYEKCLVATRREFTEISIYILKITNIFLGL